MRELNNMMKNILLFAGIGGLVFLWAQALQARFGSVEAANVKSPVVVELFTSQSCSSCPPADRLLGEIADHPNVIVLGFHVTYWNHLHWKDTLSQEFSTQRQRNYSRAKGQGRVYTPQMIVNGQAEFVGSNASKLNKSLAAAKPLQTITIEKMAENALKLSLPELKNDGNLNYTVRVFGVKEKTPVEIQRGENRGRSLTYHNAVIFEQSLGAWMGKAEDKVITIPMDENIDHYVALAQAGGFGEITAVGKIGN